jgi:hypothetical protein
MEDIINAAARGNAHIALLDNRNLTAVWDSMSSYAAAMGLTPMTTHYIDLLNYDTNLIRRKMDEGSICISTPHRPRCRNTSQYVHRHAIPVIPGFFVHIKSEFQYIAISKGDVKFRAMTLNNFLKCKRVGDSYFCKDGNVVRDVPNYSKPPKETDPIERELCLIALFKEKYEHVRKHCLITFQRQTPQVKQVGPATFAI